jgi:RHS repeat-associated protein
MYSDPETGLYHNGAREYSANSGGYVQVDPLGLVAGTNPYRYANNNPFGFTDVHGLDPNNSTACQEGSVLCGSGSAVSPTACAEGSVLCNSSGGGGFVGNTCQLGDLCYTGGSVSRDAPTLPDSGSLSQYLQCLDKCMQDNVPINPLDVLPFSPFPKAWAGFPTYGNASPFTSPLSVADYAIDGGGFLRGFGRLASYPAILYGDYLFGVETYCTVHCVGR